MMKTITHIYNKYTLINKIPSLDISEAGIDEDNDPYITLKNSFRFYGILPTKKDKKYYSLLPAKVKKTIPFECFKVAQDIVIRYIEGGLKYRGPKKNTFYQVKENDIVAEMGSYMGYFSMKLAKIVGAKGKVFAIEPIPQNLRVLNKNITFNNIQNCQVIPKGVWNEKSTMDFFKVDKDNQSSSILMKNKGKVKLEIEVDSLDNMLIEDCKNKMDFMVIQLNGVEIEALKGMEKLKPKNLAIAARYDRPNVDTINYIKETLISRNYKVNILDERYVFGTLKD